MRAVLQDRYGSPEQALRIADVDRPVPQEDEVLVRVHATSVNPIDSAIVAGEVRSWMDYEFPVTIGLD